MKKDNGCFEAFLAVILVFAIALVVNLIFAGIAAWMWGLIIVPVFGAPVLTYWQMYGIMVLISCILPTRVNTSNLFD